MALALHVSFWFFTCLRPTVPLALLNVDYFVYSCRQISLDRVACVVLVVVY